MTNRPAVPLLRSAGAFAGDLAGFARWRGVAASGLVLAAAAVEGASLLLLLPVLDVIVGGGDFQSRLPVDLPGDPNDPSGLLLPLLGAFLLLMGARAAILFGRDVMLARLQADFLASRREAVFAALAGASWSRVSGLRHARLVNLLSADFQRMGVATQVLLQGLVAAVLLVVQGVIAFSLSPVLTLAVAGIVFIPLVLMLAASRTHRAGAALTGFHLALTGEVTTFLQGLKSAIAQNTQGRFLRQLASTQTSLVERQQAFVRGQAVTRTVLSLVAAAAAAAAVFIGITMLVLPAAVLITLVLLFSRMTGPAVILQQSVQQLVFALPAHAVVAALRQELEEAAEARGAAEPPEGPIVFDAVTYQHPDGGGVRELDLTLEPGAFLGVTGPSGAGKTTFVDLLVGLLAPQAGRVTVGGQALGPANVAGWRNAIAYVPQEAFLFHASIRANLTAAAGEVAEADVWAALRLAGAEELVRRLPEGLDTSVGERGTRLSGGERQRLALAAALLRRPRLLVLDEATNAIDLAAEAQILEALAALSPRPTTVMVAHRPESLRWCDRQLSLAPQ